jgi:hypothetical protein
MPPQARTQLQQRRKRRKKKTKKGRWGRGVQVQRSMLSSTRLRTGKRKKMRTRARVRMWAVMPAYRIVLLLILGWPLHPYSPVITQRIPPPRHL